MPPSAVGSVKCGKPTSALSRHHLWKLHFFCTLSQTWCRMALTRYEAYLLSSNSRLAASAVEFHCTLWEIPFPYLMPSFFSCFRDLFCDIIGLPEWSLLYTAVDIVVVLLVVDISRDVWCTGLIEFPLNHCYSIRNSNRFIRDSTYRSAIFAISWYSHR